MFTSLCPILIYSYCPVMGMWFRVPPMIECPGFQGCSPIHDPPEGEYEPYNLPDVVVEYNPPEINYKEQDVPKTFFMAPYHEIEHGYEYSDSDDSYYKKAEE